jgi:uncharacterized protein YxeA
MILKDISHFYRRNFKFFLYLLCWTILVLSSSQVNDPFVNKANAQSCSNNLPISGVTASGNDGNVPSNVLDNNLATRWSSNGIGQWIRADLGSVQNICSVDIAWYNGNARQYHFVIATSTDGTTFTNKFSGDSSGTTLNSEKYTIPATDARYVRVTVNGNTVNTWASITELDIFGTASSSGSCTTNLPISGVTASGSQSGNPPSNVLDNNLATRWSSDGIGQWVRADLGSVQNICSVDIAWYSGNTRQYHFVIATSTDGTTFTNKFSGDSSGTTLNSEKYTIPATDARYVRVTVNGNTANNWASITELDIFGSGTPPPPSGCTTNLPISGVTASGSQSGNPPSNVLDNDLATRWSSDGIGQFITADLSSIQNICSVDIAWYSGNTRQYHFVIATSTDGTTFTNKFSGDSSGTTLNSEKYVIPATDARYVRVTVNGNTVNTWASITELDTFGSPVSNVDQFGIKKLYSTKNNGEEWFINMDNPLSDSRFNPQNTITKNPDGSWKMKSTQVRMNVYTSTGYDSANIPTLDHSVIASKGYMLAPNDWRNFEMTQYVRVNTSPSDDNFAPYGRGGRHTGSGPPEGCEGSSMKGDVFFSGKVRFAKEQWHVSYVFTNIKTATGSIEDKWVGIKFIIYNFVENNKVVVKTELWLDTNNNGNFVKVDENVDRGGWGTEGTACGGAPDQIISWGGPITTFRWDTATDVDFKFLSIREILPPQ